MKKDRNMDELFREKFRNYEQMPPAYLLENILAGAAGVRRNRKLVFWKIAGIAAAVLLAFIAGWQFNALNTEPAEQAVMISQSNTPEGKTERFDSAAVKPVTEQTEIQESKMVLSDIAPVESGEKVLASNSIQFQETEIQDQTAEDMQVLESDKQNPLNGSAQQILMERVSENSVQEQQKENASSELAEKTIDQQIIEQNEKMYRNRKSEKEKGRWLVGAQVSPAYSVSRSTHTEVYASNMMNSGSSNPLELNGGVSLEYKTGKRWSLQTGVYYSGIGETSGNSSRSGQKDYMSASPNHGSEYLNTPVSIDASNSQIRMNSTAGVIELSGVPAGIVLGTNLEENSMGSVVVVSDARFIQNFEYIEIPLYLRYTILDSRFDIEMLGGFSTNLLVGNETFMEGSSGKDLIGKTKDMEALNYSGTLGIGFKYGLSKRIYLNVEPRIKYFLNSLNSNSSVTYKPYTIGVFTGLSYEF